MRRRSFIRASTGAAVATLSVSLSGCSSLPGTGSGVQDSDGDGVIDSEDYAPNDPAVQDKSDIAGSNSNTQEQEAPEQTAKQTTESNRSERQEILNVYNNAISVQNEGMSALNQGISQFNEDNLQAAEQSANDAKQHFETMEKRCSNAYDLSLQIENENAQQICDRGRQYAVLMTAAADESELAAVDAQNGNTEAANDHINTHQANLTEARRSAPRDPAVLQDVLNL